MRLGLVLLLAGLGLVASMAACGPPPPGPFATPTPIGPSPLTVQEAPAEVVEKIALILNPELKSTPTAVCTTLGCEIASENGCLGCHTTDGTALVGPTWKGLFGKDETLENDNIVKVDEAYLEESITNPNAKIVKGFQGDIMITVPLEPDEIAAVISYIKTLK